MTHGIERTIAFALMGLIVGGIVAGGDYSVLAIPAMTLYSLAAWKVFLNLGKAIKTRTIKHSYFLSGLFLTVYALFMFQGRTILATGSTLFPNLWWAVHGGVAMYVYLRAHIVTKA